MATNWQTGSGDWDDPSNWDNGVPTSSVDAVVDGTDLAPGLTVTFDNTGTESANSLTMTDSTLAVTSGELSLGTASTLDDVSLTGGVLDFADTGGVISTITDTLSQTSGTLEIDTGTLELDNYATFAGAPSIDLANGSDLLIAGSADLAGESVLYLYGSGTLVDDGSFTVAGDLLLEADSASDGTSVTIDSTAILDFDTTNSFASIEDGGTLGVVNNAGLLEVTGGGDSQADIDTTFINTGTVLVQSGTLVFQDGTNDMFGGTLTGPGEVEISSNSAVLEAGLDLTNLGSLDIAGQVTLDGSLSFAGDFSDSGILDLNGQTLDLSGPASFSNMVEGPGAITVDQGVIDGSFGGGATLVDAGTVAQSSVFYLADQIGDTAAVSIDAGATWDIVGDYNIDSFGGGAITNAGLFEKTGGDSTILIDGSFNSTGTVNVGSGIYFQEGTNSFAGALAGGVIYLADPTTFDSGLSLQVGTIEILPGGYLTLDGSFSYGGSFFAGNGGPTVLDLNGNGLTLTGPVTLAAGAGIEGLGVLTIDGAAAIGGVDDVVLYDGATLADEGTVLQEGVLFLGGSTTDTNMVTIDAGFRSAAWDIAGNYQISGQGTADIVNGNNGLFEKTVGLGTSIIGVDFNNTGTVAADSGTIAFEGANNTFGGILEGPGEIDLRGTGTFALASGLTLNVGTLGIYDTNTDVILNTGIDYTGQFTLGSGANLNLHGDEATFTGEAALDGGVEGPGTITVDDATAGGLLLYGGATLIDTGTVTQSGNIQLGVSAGDTTSITIDSGATWNIIGNTNSSNGIGAQGLSVIDNLGLFEKTEDASQSNVAPNFSNAGTVVADHGTINFQGTLTNVGTLLAQDGGVLIDQTALSGGSGKVDIGTYGTIDFVSTVASSQTIAFTGTNGDLVLSDPKGVAAAIDSFASGDTIDLAGIVVNGISYVGGMLTLTDTVNGTLTNTITLDVPGIADPGSLALVDDGSGGTDIVLNHAGPAFTTPTGAISSSYWATDATGDWSTPGNWITYPAAGGQPVGGVPGSSDNVSLQPNDGGSTNFTVTFDTTDTVNNLSGPSFVTLDMTGGKLTVNEGGSVGGEVVQTAGTLDAVSGLGFGLLDQGSLAVDEVDSNTFYVAGATLAGTVEGDGKFYLDGGYNFTIDSGFTDTTTALELGVNGDGFGSSTTLETNFTYDGAFYIDNYSGNNAVLNLNGYTFDLTGTGILQADIAGPGEFIVAGSVVGGAAGYGGLYTSGGATLLDAGTITEAFNGASIGGLLWIESGATYNIVDDIGINAAGTPLGTIDNTGLFEKTRGEGLSVISGEFNTTGTFAIDSGTVQLNYGPDTLGGIISGPGSLALSSGYFTIDSGLSVTIPSFEEYGGDILLGANTLTLSGNDGLHQYVDGTGAVATSGTLSVDNLILGSGVTLDNTGLVTQAAPIKLGDSASPAAEITNQAGGTWELLASNNFNAVDIDNYLVGTLNPGFFLNQGLVEEIGGTYPVLVEAGFTNTADGTLDIGTGGIDFLSAYAGSTLTDSFAGLIEGPGELDLTNNATLDAGAGLTLDVADVTMDSFETVDLTGNLSYAGTFDESQGTIELGGHTLSLSGPAHLNSEVEGTGVIGSSGPLNIDGLQLANGVTLDNTGSITEGGYVYLGMGVAGTAEIINESGAVYDLVDDNATIYTLGGNREIINKGLFESTGGVSQSLIDNQSQFGVSIGATLDNMGTVEITAGNVSFSVPTFTNDGTVIIDNAAATLDNIVDTTGGTFDLTNSYLLIQGTVDSGQQFYFDPSTIDIRDVADFSGTLHPSGGDTILFEGADSGTYDNGAFTLSSFGSVIGTIAAPGYSDTDFTFTTNNGTLEVQDTQAPCYCRGTQILTERGEVPVEALQIGDRLATRNGLRPIKWIGHRGYDGRFIRGKREMLPIIVSAGALAHGVPARDLWVSPEHALWVEGVLVPAKLLVNGMTITQVDAVERLEYFHIELDSHDVIFAEGAPAETYIECDNRLMFHNAAEFAALYPETQPSGIQQSCAPRLEDGAAALTAIHARLLGRAAALGHRVTGDPGLHLIADGVAVEPLAVADGVYRFTLEHPPSAVHLASRSAVPAETDAESTDRRRLGVCLRRITLRDADLTLDLVPEHHLLRDGFHEAEGEHRWTAGMAQLPASVVSLFAGPLSIEIAVWPSQVRYTETPAHELRNAADCPQAPAALRLAG